MLTVQDLWKKHELSRLWVLNDDKITELTGIDPDADSMFRMARKSPYATAEMYLSCAVKILNLLKEKDKPNPSVVAPPLDKVNHDH